MEFAYRELGQHHGGPPLVLLTHLAAVLDNWDPRVVNGLAAQRHVIAFDNRGEGASSRSPANTIEQMADDAITFLRAQRHAQVDLFGFSMGGMIAQEMALKEPALVRKLILAGTGPAGGEGISAVAGVANVDLLRGFFTGQDPKQFLFFTRTPNGIEAGKAFLQRLSARSGHRDKDITLRAYVAQLQALNAWGKKAPADLSYIHQPVLVVNGDSDRMVPNLQLPGPGAQAPEQHAGHLPRCGPWGRVPVPHPLRLPGAGISRAVSRACIAGGECCPPARQASTSRIDASLPNCALANGHSETTLVPVALAHCTSASSSARPTPWPLSEGSTSVWSTMIIVALVRL